MGYAVYEDRDARDHGVSRWAGYGVPAVCDHPDCATEIDRGMAYKCGELGGDNFGELHGDECTGCGLYFCSAHQFGDHSRMIPKPDIPRWEHHILLDPSWAEWRKINANLIPDMEERTKDFPCSEDCEHNNE